MTKLRAPITCEDALTKVAGTLTYARLAQILDRPERTVRNWSEPDTSPAAADAITLGMALELDKQFRLAGGIGAPLLSFYALRLEADVADASVHAVAIAEAAARVAREGGQALEAAIIASVPGADVRLLDIAERESEEAVAASTDLVITIGRARKARANPSGQEVPPPAVNGREAPG